MYNRLLERFLSALIYIQILRINCGSLHSTTPIREVLWSSSNPYWGGAIT